MNYLYNGVELPELPEWDKQSHPNAVITSSMSGALVLLGVGTLYYYTQSGGRYVFAFKDSTTYRAKNGEWVLYDDGTWYENRPIASPDEEYSDFVVWTDTDILSQSGSVWLAASDPIPISSFTPDPISMTMGWLVGRRIAGQRKK